MTPLFSYTTNVAVASLTANTGWCPILIPELTVTTPTQYAQNYSFANGATPLQTGGTPVVFPTTFPIVTGITAAKVALTGASGITAGTIQIATLGLDGNWHIASSALTVTASTSYYQTFGAGYTAGSFTVTDGAPFLGICLIVGTTFATAGLTFIQLMGIGGLLDPAFSRQVIQQVKV